MEEYATFRNVITGIFQKYCKFFSRHHNKVCVAIKWRWRVLPSLCRKRNICEAQIKQRTIKRVMPIVNFRSEELNSINDIVMMFSSK